MVNSAGVGHLDQLVKLLPGFSRIDGLRRESDTILQASPRCR